MASLGTGVPILVSGCVDYLGMSGDQPDRKEYPEVPEPLTAENAEDFVKEHEAAEVYNYLVESENPDSVTVSCDTVFDRDIDSSYYIITKSAGTVTHDSVFEPASIAHYETYRVTYCISPEQVSRVELDQRTKRYDDPHVGDQDEMTPEGFRLLNFADDKYGISVLISSGEKADGEPIFDEKYILESNSGIEQPTIIAEEGTYQLILSLEDGESEGFQWEVPTTNDYATVRAYISPEGDLHISELPEEEPTP